MVMVFLWPTELGVLREICYMTQNFRYWFFFLQNVQKKGISFYYVSQLASHAKSDNQIGFGYRTWVLTKEMTEWVNTATYLSWVVLDSGSACWEFHKIAPHWLCFPDHMKMKTTMDKDVCTEHWVQGECSYYL